MSESGRRVVAYLGRTYEHRERVVVPVPLDYGARAELHLPTDLSQAEAERISRMVLAWAVPGEHHLATASSQTEPTA